MKTHQSVYTLIRQYLLFTLTVLFLLTLARAGYNLWHFTQVSDVPTLVQSFWQGFKFDLASVGVLLAVPVFVVPLLAMFRATVPLARWFSLLWVALAFVLLVTLELVTPYFLESSAVRPDASEFASAGGVVDMLADVWSRFMIPAIIGTVLVVLILIAFWGRLNTRHFLRKPVKMIPAIMMSVFGLAFCVMATHASIDLTKPMIDPSAALVSTESVVNEITLNSTYKGLYALLSQ